MQNTTKNTKDKILERIQQFCLFDDDFMTKCFEDNPECTELVLRIIMDKADLKVTEARTQYTIKNLQGRSIRLDVDAVDSSGKEYDIEIQRADKGAGVRRARYNSSLIDANALLPGDDTENLPETYVIFITENDVLGGNKPIYHIQKAILETQELFNDGAHILYVNGAWKDESPLGLLMRDFSCKNPKDMHYKLLADRVKYFKEDEKGVKAMCRAVEELCQEERREAMLETMIETAKRLLAEGTLTVEKIAECVGLPVEEVRKLAEQK